MRSLRALSTASSSSPARAFPHPLTAYLWKCSLNTRWADNDIYGHLNNTVYYALIDTAVNKYLLDCGALRLPPHQAGEAIGVVVSSGCTFFSSLAYPDTVTAGLRATRVGTTSVTYEVGLFPGGANADANSPAAAQGYFTHVYVDAATRRPVRLPRQLATAVDALR